MSSASDSLVKGPVAKIVICWAFGRYGHSSLTIFIRGWEESSFVIDRLNWLLSTASAPPAGTECWSAFAITIDFKFLYSSCKRPAALSLLIAPKLLLQTSSANSGEWWAGDFFFGRISKRVTLTPALAICHAASDPARPAPITITDGSSFKLSYFLFQSLM